MPQRGTKRESLTDLLNAIKEDKAKRIKYATDAEVFKKKAIETILTQKEESKKLVQLEKTCVDELSEWVSHETSLCRINESLLELTGLESISLFDFLLSFPPMDEVLTAFQRYNDIVSLEDNQSLLTICTKYHLQIRCEYSLEVFITLVKLLSHNEHFQRELNVFVLQLIRIENCSAADITAKAIHNNSSVIASLQSFLFSFMEFLDVKTLISLLFLKLNFGVSYYVRIVMRLKILFEQQEDVECFLPVLNKLSETDGRWLLFLSILDYLEESATRHSLIKLFEASYLDNNIDLIRNIYIAEKTPSLSFCKKQIIFLFYLRIKVKATETVDEKVKELFAALSDTYNSYQRALNKNPNSTLYLTCLEQLQHCISYLQPKLPREDVFGRDKKRQSILSEYSAK